MNCCYQSTACRTTDQSIEAVMRMLLPIDDIDDAGTEVVSFMARSVDDIVQSLRRFLWSVFLKLMMAF